MSGDLLLLSAPEVGLRKLWNLQEGDALVWLNVGDDCCLPKSWDQRSQRIVSPLHSTPPLIKHLCEWAGATLFGGPATSTPAVMNQGSLLLIPLCIMLIVTPGLGKRAEQFRLEGISAGHLMQPSCSKLTSNLHQVSQTLVQSSFLYICRWTFQATALFSIETAIFAHLCAATGRFRAKGYFVAWCKITDEICQHTFSMLQSTRKRIYN